VNRVVFALVALLLVGSALGQSPEPANFRITTWNLEWFPNGSAREASQEKQAQGIKAAADVLKELNPDMKAEQSGLLTRMATESVSSCVPKTYWLRSWNWNG
jgi:hypothetical protein